MRKELFMFPNAGGTIELFSNLCSVLHEEYDTYPFEYPGHGSNKAVLCNSIEKLSREAYSFWKLNHNPESKYILMGYSMGTIVAMKLMEIIQNNNEDAPIGMVLAADPPVNTIIEDLSKSEDENIKAFYMRNGDIPEKLFNSKLFGRLYFPSFRNDYIIMKSFDYSDLMRENDTKALVLYCEDDTPFEMIGEWSKLFKHRPTYIQFSNGHFFIKEYYKEIAWEIKKTF